VATVIRIRSRDITRLRRQVDGMRNRAADLTPAWEVFADWFAEQERIQFTASGIRWGAPWKPLAASTLAAKRRRGLPPDILVRTGALERSLRTRPFSIERLAPHTMSLGTRISYAHFHQDGTTQMPDRPLLSARAVAREDAISSAVSSWVYTGRPHVHGWQ
jgi:hypothetical protein